MKEVQVFRYMSSSCPSSSEIKSVQADLSTRT